MGRSVSSVSRVLVLLFVASCFPRVASATTIQIGLISFDSGVSPAGTTFDITTLTGSNAFPPDFPITTPLTFTVTGLTASTSGGPLSINGSDFTSVDAQGDLDCTALGDAGLGGCDFGAYNILSATLTGTLSPLTGLAVLPSGFSGIASTFSATITPDPLCGGRTLTAGCDSAIISATLVAANPAAVPEPPTGILVVGLLGLLAVCKLNQRSQLLKRLGVFRA
jgi:hypothetical protein